MVSSVEMVGVGRWPCAAAVLFYLCQGGFLLAGEGLLRRFQAMLTTSRERPRFFSN